MVHHHQSTIIQQIILLSLLSSTASNLITTPPVDTVGCCGSVSSFYCDSNRTDVLVIQWHIDGVTITNDVKKEREITVSDDIKQLNIIAIPTNDDIAIGCNIVTSSPPYTESAGGSFTVSNIPSVESLYIEYTNNTLSATWSEPYCLPTNYTYQYTVQYNMTNQTIITGNTTDTMFTAATVLELCVYYIVSVRVIALEYTDECIASEMIKTKATCQYTLYHIYVRT